jgi:DNA polymerase-3 subunit delta
MKIIPSKVETTISTIDKSNYFACLIYGPDVGGVSNLANKIAKKIVTDPSDAFSTTNLDNERIANEPTLIYDEMSSISFFGGRKLIYFKNADGSKETLEAIKNTAEGLPNSAKKGSFLLVTAGDLATTSALRKFFESNNETLCIACYVEDEKDLSAKIMRIFAQKGLKSKERGIIEYLADSCQGDSKIIEHEIEKLEIYLGDRKEVSLNDVILTTGNTTETDIQDICDLVCSGNKIQAEIALRKALESGIQPIAIIRSLQRYIEKLQICSTRIQSERKTADEVISLLRPPVFYKRIPAFKAHINFIAKKPSNDVWKSYKLLYEAEEELKTSGSEPELITSRLVSNLF